MQAEPAVPAGAALPPADGADHIAMDCTASPCVNVCVMNATSGLCDGCLRTLDEIAGWSNASDEQKRRTWQRIRQRQAGL